MSYIQKRGHNSSWRNLLMRNLATNMILHGELKIIKERAKILQPLVEKLITLAKKNDIKSIKRIEAILFNTKVNKSLSVLQFLVKELAPRYQDKNGGYTRIVNSGERKGDNAKLVKIMFV
jgi:large subunit ribosomal protein L17